MCSSHHFSMGTLFPTCIYTEFVENFMFIHAHTQQQSCTLLGNSSLNICWSGIGIHIFRLLHCKKWILIQGALYYLFQCTNKISPWDNTKKCFVPTIGLFGTTHQSFKCRKSSTLGPVSWSVIQLHDFGATVFQKLFWSHFFLVWCYNEDFLSKVKIPKYFMKMSLMMMIIFNYLDTFPNAFKKGKKRGVSWFSLNF